MPSFRGESNPEPRDYKSRALPNCATKAFKGGFWWAVPITRRLPRTLRSPSALFILPYYRSSLVITQKCQLRPVEHYRRTRDCDYSTLSPAIYLHPHAQRIARPGGVEPPGEQ